MSLRAPLGHNGTRFWFHDRVAATAWQRVPEGTNEPCMGNKLVPRLALPIRALPIRALPIRALPMRAVVAGGATGPAADRGAEPV